MHEDAVEHDQPPGVAQVSEQETAGELIRRLRGDRTQDDVARALGVKPQSVSAWEHGGSINWKHIDALEKYLDADGQIIEAFRRRAEEQVNRRGGPGSVRTGLAPVLQALAEADRKLDVLTDRAERQEQSLRALTDQVVEMFDRLELLERQAGSSSGRAPATPPSTTRNRPARPTPPPETA